MERPTASPTITTDFGQGTPSGHAGSSGSGSDGGGGPGDPSRHQLLIEWIRHDAEFVACLDSIQQQLAAPILDRVYADPGCCDALPGLPIFLSGVRVLYAAHAALLRQLEKASLSWCDRSSTIGDIVCDHIGIIRVLLRVYSRAIGIVAAALRWSLSQSEPTFLPAVVASTLREESFHFLSNPLGRLPYYEQMLQRLFDQTDLDHADRSQLSRAIKFVRSAAMQIASVKELCRQHQSVCYLEQILGVHLIDRNRVLILQGELLCSFDDRNGAQPADDSALWTLAALLPGKRRRFLTGLVQQYPVLAVLFTDVLVLARRLPDGKLSVFDVVPLHSVAIEVSQSGRQQTLNVTCADRRVYHLTSQNPTACARWVGSLMKAHADAVKTKGKADDDFCMEVVCRNEPCQLRIAQQTIVITAGRHDRVCLDVATIRQFSDDGNECAVQLLAPRKHFVVVAKTVDDAHRMTRFINMEQMRTRPRSSASLTCCERAKLRSLHSNHVSCSLCGSSIVCSACLHAAVLMRGKRGRSVACRACQTSHYQQRLGCTIPELVDDPDRDRNWVQPDSSGAGIGCYEARRIRLSRRLGVTRLSELDHKPSIQLPQLEPDQCISAPLLRLRDDLCKEPPPSSPRASAAGVPRVQCAACQEFKSLNSENRFCGICGHAENVVNERVAFLFALHDCEKALVRQQIALFNAYFPHILDDINTPSKESELAYRPPILSSMTSFDKKSPSSASSHLSFVLEGRFIGKGKCQTLTGQRPVLNAGIASLCASMRMLLDLFAQMLGELEDHLHQWTRSSNLSDMLLRYFPPMLSCIRLFLSNYYEAMEQFSTKPWKFRFQHLQLRHGIRLSAFEMFSLTFDRIRCLYGMLYKENQTEDGTYCDQLLQISGGLTLLINRVRDRHISTRLARILALPVSDFCSERLLLRSVVQSMVPGKRVMETLLLLTTDVCILTLGRNATTSRPIVYTCPRRACNFTSRVAQIANTELSIHAVENTFNNGREKQSVLLLGRFPSETLSLMQTLSQWKNAQAKSLSAVTIHSPRFRSSKSALQCNAPSMHFGGAKSALVRQCPGCARICASTFCSACGTRTSQITTVVRAASAAVVF